MSGSSPGEGAVCADTEPSRRTPAPWYQKYRFALFLTDLLAIVVALLTAQYTRFGGDPGVVVVGPTILNYELVGVVFELIWVFALTVNGSRSKRVVGSGLNEYRKVVHGSFAAFGIVAIVSYLLKVDLSRFYFVVALPVGVLLLLASRIAWRWYLTDLRIDGRALTGTLVIGDQEEVDRAIGEMRRHPEAGYVPVAVSLRSPGVATGDSLLAAFPQVPTSQLRAVARSAHIGAVMVAGSMPRRQIRELAWELENADVELILVSRLTDVAGPRIHVSPVDALPMVHVDLPEFSGFSYLAKRLFDVLFSVVVLVALLPLFALVAAAIKLDDRGPVMFLQDRIGQNGHVFTIHKFRTMGVDAEDRIDALIQGGGGTALLFKMKNDPRVTRVGRFLRKYSLDELPQFWTVLKGSMSVVGPRPQVEREVAQYDQHVYRRLLIKPGITGLWQVSGRSQLSIEESVRLDLNYVENWSITGDVVIILRTIRAVFKPDGAY